MKTWSKQQEAIFGWFRFGKEHVVVRARAGTGKTTTILEGINHAPERNIVLCAFNKRIADELSKRLSNSNAEAKTLHAIGFGFIRNHWKNVKVDGDRGMMLVNKVINKDEVPRDIALLICKLAARAKGTLPFPTLEKMVSEAEEADLIPEDEFVAAGFTTAFVAQKAMDAMDLACLPNDGMIDFDDMVFVPLRNKWVFGRWNLVVVDEAQDMSYAQLLLAQKVCKKGGRIAVVGDDRQAIYGFRGADHRSLDKLKTALKAAELGLTITYRCPQLIVNLAKEIVPDFEFAPGAPTGIIENSTREKLTALAQPGDFVLSRKNAPLAKVCLAFLRANKRAFIEGKDIGKTLIALVKKVGGKSIPDFMTRLGKWKERELKRANRLDTETKRDNKIELVTDQAETLLSLVDGLTGVAELTTRIDGLFADMAEGRHGTSIVCSSVHKAKGLERDNVYLLEETFTDRNIEERNIRYVAITRSKNRLVWIYDGALPETVPNPPLGIITDVLDPNKVGPFMARLFHGDKIADVAHSILNVGIKHHGDIA